MELSYWEYKSWLSDVDFAIIGSGIVGLNCALQLRQKYPQSRILVLEKGILPQGASTKNAGFACFGSVSELLSDLKTHSEEEVVGLVQKRWNGIQLLRKLLGDETISFEQLGGHELFQGKATELYEMCLDGMAGLNQLLKPIFKSQPFVLSDNTFGFSNIQKKYITHNFEGQLDTGKLMIALLDKVLKNGIQVLNGVSVENIQDLGNKVILEIADFSFDSKKVLVATNGFAAKLLDNVVVKPARAQVLVTKPIKNLNIGGAFHFDEGYYYFRNVHDRILFGGGRNLDFETEQTTAFGQTELIQNTLEELLHTMILPNQTVEIDHRWSGIMGVGQQKTPIIERLSNNVYCGVRLGGMGVALGSLVGKELAELTS